MLRRGGYKNRLSKFLSESYFNIIFKGNLLFNYRGNKTTIQKLCKMVKRKLISYYSSTQTTIVIILVEFLPGFLQMLLLIFFFVYNSTVCPQHFVPCLFTLLYIFNRVLYFQNESSLYLRKLLGKRKWSARHWASGLVQKVIPLCWEACNN